MWADALLHILLINGKGKVREYSIEYKCTYTIFLMANKK